jgi:glucose-6-phosphate isomerase
MATVRPSITPEVTPIPTRNNGTGSGLMQLADEAVEYDFLNAIAPPAETWTPLAEIQSKNLIPRARLQAVWPSLTTLRGQIVAEREIVDPKPELAPLQAGFIDLPQKLLDAHRRKADTSELGRIQAVAARLRDEVDRVIVLGPGGTCLGPKALFEAILPTHHNELPSQTRLGRPRLYFDADGFDSDARQDLFEMLENTCIDPELRDERWGVIVVGRDDLETATALRYFRKEAAQYYGHSPRLKKVVVPITGPFGPVRELFKADGYADDEILTIPDNVGGRYSVFTAAGLLPAAVMGLDVRALLLGAAAMTKRFFEEPFERNPVLQLAAINSLLTEEAHKRVRVMAMWSRKLEALGRWYESVCSSSLGKEGRGPTAATVVLPRDLLVLGQALQDGRRDKFMTNVFVRSPKGDPTAVGMADHNQDGLNAISRKTYGELMAASRQSFGKAQRDVGRPSADLVLPMLSEHVLGQMMQMLMLATVAEARLMGVNPYAEAGVKMYTSSLRSGLGLP